MSEQSGREMLRYTFEIRQNDAPPISCVRSLPDQRAAWCYLELLATEVGPKPGAQILVLDSDGEVLVRAGVATALASIERCRKEGCLLKAQRKRAIAAFGD